MVRVAVGLRVSFRVDFQFWGYVEDRVLWLGFTIKVMVGAMW